MIIIVLSWKCNEQSGVPFNCFSDAARISPTKREGIGRYFFCATREKCIPSDDEFYFVVLRLWPWGSTSGRSFVRASARNECYSVSCSFSYRQVQSWDSDGMTAWFSLSVCLAEVYPGGGGEGFPKLIPVDSTTGFCCLWTQFESQCFTLHSDKYCIVRVKSFLCLLCLPLRRRPPQSTSFRCDGIGARVWLMRH